MSFWNGRRASSSRLSNLRRIRVSGVRRSWETAASVLSLSAMKSLIRRCIRLKALMVSRTSLGAAFNQRRRTGEIPPQLVRCVGQTAQGIGDEPEGQHADAYKKDFGQKNAADGKTRHGGQVGNIVLKKEPRFRPPGGMAALRLQAIPVRGILISRVR